MEQREKVPSTIASALNASSKESCVASPWSHCQACSRYFCCMIDREGRFIIGRTSRSEVQGKLGNSFLLFFDRGSVFWITYPLHCWLRGKGKLPGSGRRRGQATAAADTTRSGPAAANRQTLDSTTQQVESKRWKKIHHANSNKGELIWLY